ncbi:MAG: FmdB family zinc ribbon protein [bacterium]
MPFYEYECGACGHRLEALQKISDDPLVYCPECNEAKLKKLISAAAFRLKGTGWYETDFKNKQTASKDGKKDDKSESQSGAKTESKTDSAATPGTDSSSESSTKSKKKDSGNTSQSASA